MSMISVSLLQVCLSISTQPPKCCWARRRQERCESCQALQVKTNPIYKLGGRETTKWEPEHLIPSKLFILAGSVKKRCRLPASVVCPRNKKENEEEICERTEKKSVGCRNRNQCGGRTTKKWPMFMSGMRHDACYLKPGLESARSEICIEFYLGSTFSALKR